jgi:hypothetical protein
MIYHTKSLIEGIIVLVPIINSLATPVISSGFFGMA